jgi:hypothetical protein
MTASPGADCGPPLLPGCGPAGRWGWGFTDTGGTAIAGYGALGKWASHAGKSLGNAGLTQQELSVAGSQMRSLQLNQGLLESTRLGRAAMFGRAGLFVPVVGLSLAVVGGGLQAWAYHEAGDSWWRSIGKSFITTGVSFVGSQVGGLLGFGAGTFVGGPLDATAVPEVGGAIAGGVLGGVFGGIAGNALATDLLGP